MIVLTEDSTKDFYSASANDLKIATEAAKIMGYQVHYIPEDFSICETAENALAHIPKQPQETLGLWIGYIPTPERYQAIYNTAIRKGIKLLNSPEQHLTVQEFDRAYPKLLDLTPESIIITNQSECQTIIERLEFPVFVKGVVQSKKAKGWKACIAENLAELEILTQELLTQENGARGRVVVRKLVKFKYSRYAENGFPLGREYRVFIYREQILGWGYYWEGEDRLKKLSPNEEKQVLELAIAAAKNLNVPYISVDIGQLENDEWIVIETGDPQFSGVSQIPLLQLYKKILELSGVSYESFS
ncbi:MAG: ATP-grasp domain-containing protein [Microcoleaceae cyanobacterium]